MIWLQKTILMSRELLYDRETGKERSAVHGIILFKNTSEFHKKKKRKKNGCKKRCRRPMQKAKPRQTS